MFSRLPAPAALAGLSLLVSLNGCNDPAAAPERGAAMLAQGSIRYYGRPVTLGNGMARTYLMVDRENREVPLELPEDNPTPYRFVELNWNPRGHEPAGIYDLPHPGHLVYRPVERRNRGMGAVPGPPVGADLPVTLHREPPGREEHRLRIEGRQHAEGVVRQPGPHILSPARHANQETGTAGISHHHARRLQRAYRSTCRPISAFLR
jgi:hypothetical protein